MWQSLPKEIIHIILLFDSRFRLRKGEIVTIIPKNDERYTILHYITLKKTYLHYKCEWNLPNSFRIQYTMPTKNPLLDRVAMDMMDIKMQEIDTTLFYEITMIRKKMYNPVEWYFNKIQYHYQRC